VERVEGDYALLDHGAGVRAVRTDDVEAEVRARMAGVGRSLGINSAHICAQ
jgi:hypothetical protein